MSTAHCCAGNLHEGTPKGHETTLHGLPSYVAEPPNGASPSGFIIILPDGFGWTFKNIRILADIYAERVGARCYLPEFMDGNSLPLSALQSLSAMTDKEASIFSKIVPTVSTISSMTPFMYNNRQAVSMPRVINFFKALRESTELPIAAAGFCWGGQFVVALAQGGETVNGKPLIDVGYTAHPSNLSVPSDIEKVKLPLFIDQGSEDFVMGMPQVKQIQEVFDRKNGEERAGKGQERFKINVVEGAKHGFAVRCDMNNKDEAAQEQIAEDHAVEWFKRWFANKKNTDA